MSLDSFSPGLMSMWYVCLRRGLYIIYVIRLLFVKALMFIGSIVLVMQEVLLYMWMWTWNVKWYLNSQVTVLLNTFY